MILASEAEYICGAHQWQQPAKGSKGPNHPLSGGTAALRSCQTGDTSGTQGRGCSVDGTTGLVGFFPAVREVTGPG